MKNEMKNLNHQNLMQIDSSLRFVYTSTSSDKIFYFVGNTLVTTSPNPTLISSFSA